MLREEHGGLSCRVAAADQHDFLACAHPGLERRRPVPDAVTLEVAQAGNLRAAIARAARDHHGARAQTTPVVELHGHLGVGPALRAFERRGLRRDQDLGAELLRLHERAAGQRLPRDSGREAEVVLDARARAGLAAERAAVEHDDAEALRGRVDRGGEARRPRADDARRRRGRCARPCPTCRGGARAPLQSG